MSEQNNFAVDKDLAIGGIARFADDNQTLYLPIVDDVSNRGLQIHFTQIGITFEDLAKLHSEIGKILQAQ